MYRHFVVSLFLMGALPAVGQVVEQVTPIKANCCLGTAAQTLADQLQDWNQLGRYAADNEAVAARGAEAGRVIFLGDSITDGWKLALSFPGKPYVNRGIGGQTTPQMLVRMMPDVIRHKAAAMVLLAGNERYCAEHRAGDDADDPRQY